MISYPPKYKKILLLSRFEDKKYKEIAEELNISVNTENSLTKVLDTSFNISGYSRSPITKVTTITGRVSFKSLHTNELVFLNAENSAIIDS